MELRRRRKVLVVLLSFWQSLAGAANTTSEVANLGIAAQACLATGFWDCSCIMLDFQCGCECSRFSSDVRACIVNSCSPVQQNQALNLFSSTCATATIITTSISTKLSSTSSVSSKTTSSISQMTTTSKGTILSSSNSKASASQTITQSKATASIASNTNTSPTSMGSGTTGLSVKTYRLSSTSTGTSENGGVFPILISSSDTGPTTAGTQSTWGPYRGNTSAMGTATACWQVSASGTARTTCAIQANPFQASAGSLEPGRVLVPMIWGIGVFVFLNLN
ncbi:uncharacterized protein LY89DRAFT_785388 [Mollisia scopiformis]|uniref:CFEM domain-containing protein n=1 Tax=Mollisia scopiformis TaxID=149040 RepID=A0A194WXW0_MOLSC|nr:uncharacterized protein LY89DRAFT_785388 [Mollisia scopiformis]KUJ12811.1 hypothetical protein LY89DRAFT_785388 [Mollisia scopiformis]